MIAVFADTLYFVGLLNARDAHHRSATAFHRTYTGRVVTTEYVLFEVANFFSRAGNRETFVALIATLRADPVTDIVPASADLFNRGLALFEARPDKDWSLTDCTSFVVMTEHELTDALTSDQHFAQAGFRPLLS
jgi:uncharacterized protein